MTPAMIDTSSPCEQESPQALAVTHLHTSYSWDGNIAPSRLIDSLSDLDVRIAMVTDHDSFEGSIECRRLVTERALEIRIPIAAEIRTDRGDVIVIFENDSTRLPAIEDLKRWDDLPEAVRNRNGLIWLPHPFQGHEFIEELAAEADVIEVFNARCSAEQNRNAEFLCGRHGAVPGFGADVHRLQELGGCLVAYPDDGSVLSTLRRPPEPVRTQPAPTSSILAAEMTYAFRKRRWPKLAYNALRWAQARREEVRTGRGG